MKKLICRIIVMLISLSGTITIFGQTSDTITEDSSDMIEVKYDIVVFEPGYEVFLLQQEPMEIYSESYYKNWNLQYVNEWNIRAQTNKLIGAYQDMINYDPLTGYGIELEYKLYYFFRFIEQKYGITLVKRRGS